MFTLSQLHSETFAIVFPAGQAPNLVVAHKKFILDALIDLQEWVDCLKYNNTQVIPQCATMFNCGLTMFDAPRGIIKKVSVIDKINPDTGLEDGTAADDWCSEITYTQVDPCHIQKYLARGTTLGCCPNIPLFFAIPSCRKGAFPAPTDVGVSTLPPLPLGYHYGQVSTDDPGGRASGGIWAQERGKIFISPWLQSTETVVVKWDGKKRIWTDADPVDEDPLLKQAVEEYLRWQHAGKFDRDEMEENRARGAYAEARANLIHQCREETRIRGCEPSHARGASMNSNLFFNDQQGQFTATCQAGTTGTPITATIPAGTVASNISVADANQKAQNEAQSQATAQLDCTAIPVTYYNDAQSFTAECTGGSGAPQPDGESITVTIQAGLVTSIVSQAAANAAALAQATEAAEAQLSCVFWNSAQPFTAECPQGTSGSDVTVTKAAHTYSSTLSQADADAQALAAATLEANSALTCTTDPTLYLNTQQFGSFGKNCSYVIGGGGVGHRCAVTVLITMSAGRYSSFVSQADANTQALNAARAYATAIGNSRCAGRQCGDYTQTI